MPRVIREQELSDIIIGASFMGAGGGGGWIFQRWSQASGRIEITQ